MPKLKKVHGWELAVDPSKCEAQKVQKTYVDYRYGFPVRLKDVPMVKSRGIWTTNIDPTFLRNVLLKSLAMKKSRLTGAEIKFVRHSENLTLAQFAEHFDVSHVAVHKWEQEGENSPPIKWPLEQAIRLYIFDRLAVKDEVLGKLYRTLKEPVKPDNGKPLVARAA